VGLTFLVVCTSLVLFVAVRLFSARFRYRTAYRSVRKRVLIIGGGFAGLQVVKDLAKKCEVTVVDVRDFFEYTPGVLSALVGGRPLRRGLTSASTYHSSAEKLLKAENNRSIGALMRVRQLHRSLRRAVPKKARFVKVSPEHNLSLRPGKLDISTKLCETVADTVSWDYLVLATGSVYPTPMKPETFSSNEKDTTSSLRHAQLAAHASRIARAKHVLIIGGGIVGVELAAELAAAAGRSPQRLTLTHSATSLLDGLPSSASEHATEWLKRHGVEILLGERFESSADKNAEGGHCYRGVNSQAVIIADEVIFASGSRAATDFLQNGVSLSDANDDSVAPHLRVPLDTKGRIQINEDTFRVDCGVSVVPSENGSERKIKVFCVGDAASKSVDRYLASFAHWEAEYVSESIMRDINIQANGGTSDTSEVAPFRPPPRFMCVSLGPFDGIFIWDARIICSGLMAAVLKLAIELWFKNFLPAPYSVCRLLPRLDS
jgi:NADH dehydrogenase FAD-containing subunit